MYEETAYLLNCPAYNITLKAGAQYPPIPQHSAVNVKCWKARIQLKAGDKTGATATAMKGLN
ncbi:MAG: hypothetical protein ACHQHN_15440 [Sphingobacteriales bacterium]